MTSSADLDLQCIQNRIQAQQDKEYLKYKAAFNPKSTNIFFALKIVCLLHSMHFRLDFIMEANTMSPDQTDPLGGSDLGPYCLQIGCLKHKQTR